MGVRNDILSLIYLMNKEARVTVKTPVGDTDPILLTNLVISRELFLAQFLITAHLTKCQHTVLVIILAVFS